MKKIKQNIEVNANVLEFKEKLALLPLVEILAASIRTNKAVKLNVEDTLTISIQPEISETICKILKEIIDEDLKDIIHYTNPKSILLVNPGANKPTVAKIIKDHLHLNLKETKDIVDNTPAEIHLTEMLQKAANAVREYTDCLLIIKHELSELKARIRDLEQTRDNYLSLKRELKLALKDIEIK